MPASRWLTLFDSILMSAGVEVVSARGTLLSVRSWLSVPHPGHCPDSAGLQVRAGRKMLRQTQQRQQCRTDEDWTVRGSDTTNDG